MFRRFALLFVSTFVAVFLVRIPSFPSLLSGSESILFHPDSALATLSPSSSIIPTSLIESSPAGSALAPGTFPEIRLPVDVHYRFYSIGGTTADELRSQLAQQSPVNDAEGRSFDALTSWNVYWNFRYARRGKTCSARSINTKLDVVFTLPRWKAPRYVSSGLWSEWNSYMTALKLHEEGHKKNGVDAADSVLQALHQLPAYPTCHQLEKAAKEAAERVIAAYNRRDVEYDRATGHGRTQGAVFPIVNTASQPVPHPSL